MKTRTAVLMTTGVAIVAVIASLHISSNGLWLSTKTKPKKYDPLNIEFEVYEDDDDGTVLRFKNPQCRVKNENSCFKVKKGYRGVVKYVFDDDSDYRLTEYEICKGLEKETRDCSLDLAERLEFFVSDDRSGTNVYMTNDEGVIDLSGLEPKSGGETEFFVINQNTIRANYFYSITACIPDTEDCISTDPPVVNKGRN